MWHEQKAAGSAYTLFEPLLSFVDILIHLSSIFMAFFLSRVFGRIAFTWRETLLFFKD